jgi:hypothetical protein
MNQPTSADMLDEPGDIAEIRRMILRHRGVDGSPSTTILLVEQMLAELAAPTKGDGT